MKRGMPVIALLALLLAIVYPLVFNSNFEINFGVLVLFAAFIGQSWNLAGGFAGQLSFGHVVFFGVGAYTATIFQMKLGLSPWLALPGAAVTGAMVGALIGVLSYRAGLRGSYFALITLAFAEVFRILANSVGWTGGGLGMLIPLKPGAGNFQFPERIGFYYVILALVALSILITCGPSIERFSAALRCRTRGRYRDRQSGTRACRPCILR